MSDTLAAAGLVPASTPLDDARSQLADVVGFLGYSDGIHAMLATARRTANSGGRCNIGFFWLE